MSETELWRRLVSHLGAAYAATWADQVVISELGRTVSQALADRVSPLVIWRAVWRQLDLDPVHY